MIQDRLRPKFHTRTIQLALIEHSQLQQLFAANMLSPMTISKLKMRLETRKKIDKRVYERDHNRVTSRVYLTFLQSSKLERFALGTRRVAVSDGFSAMSMLAAFHSGGGTSCFPFCGFRLICKSRILTSNLEYESKI